MRQRLLAEVEGWKNCIPITLTLGRWVGDGDAAKAWESVTKREKVRKLMDAVGATRWVWFLEPQGDGYPHWHVLAEVGGASTAEGLGKLRRKVWSLWGPRYNRETGEATKTPGRWDLGIVNIDRNKLVAQGPRAVVAYCTSYVTKAGDVPAWMLDDNAERRVRKFGASRRVGALRGASGPLDAGDADDGRGDEKPGDEEPRRRQCLRERLAWCGHRCQVFYQQTDRATGEVRRQYVCELEMNALNSGFLRGYLGFGLDVGYWVLTSEDGHRTWVAGAWFSWGPRDDGAVREALNKAVHRSGLGELTRVEVAARRDAIVWRSKGILPRAG